ncbi:coagulation factor VIIi isoform X1 [Hemibagrus wyckioides]|nr:coagulation factor VIIi isoform X1 [Hemibagrus wyckioides]XP_058236068.1 coagulation factor VIIi isoform X1 [Hemibagrus wyckioides]XP_058236069.1 coagulation factor VIIi isoform X1 [Hemibagrus wyckioides]
MKKKQTILALFLFCHAVAGAVFLRRDDANSVLRRSRRANSGFLEEVKGGNLERECIEEICDYEEAREVFEDDDLTTSFWMSYKAREPCLTNPCRNNGTCIYLGHSYICQCPEGFEGKYCQEAFEDTLKCRYLNGGCEQFCDGSGRRRKCTCAPGYALGEDGKSCIAQVQYPCGKAPLYKTQTRLIRAVGGHQCPKGHCPWQVLLKYDGRSLCGGVLVGANWILTAGHCVSKRDVKYLKVVAGDHNIDIVDGTEQEFSVSQVIIHKSYDPASGDSDLALLQLSEPVTLSNYTVPICLPSQGFAKMELDAVRFHTVSGWGQSTDGGNIQSSRFSKILSPVLRKLAVPLLPTPECSVKSGVNITDNMFCAGYFEGSQESCRGDDGSPLTTQYKDTHFLTGIVSWGKGCGHPGFYTIYTKVANFLDWIQHGMATSIAQPDALDTLYASTMPTLSFEEFYTDIF